MNPLNGFKVEEHDRITFDAVKAADWIGAPDFFAPTFKFSAVLLVLPAVIALIAENTGHVKAVSIMTKRELDPMIGRAIMADGVGTAVATSFGGSPTTTYAENIGVMAATRIYSTAAYYVAGVIAILFGLCPKFGALVSSIPNGVLGGVTVVLYGMIGLLGAKIWVENQVDFANPINLVPIGAGIILAIGPVTHKVSHDFDLGGIALGTIVVLGGYHLLRWLAPAFMRDALEKHRPFEEGAALAVGHTGVHHDPYESTESPPAQRGPDGDGAGEDERR
jgi:xanthine/uracil permease